MATTEKTHCNLSTVSPFIPSPHPSPLPSPMYCSTLPSHSTWGLTSYPHTCYGSLIYFIYIIFWHSFHMLLLSPSASFHPFHHSTVYPLCPRGLTKALVHFLIYNLTTLSPHCPHPEVIYIATTCIKDVSSPFSILHHEGHFRDCHDYLIFKRLLRAGRSFFVFFYLPNEEKRTFMGDLHTA